MKKGKLVIGLILIMIFSFTLLPATIHATPDGESWLAGWSYRKSHVINGASGAGTNYQVRLLVYYGSGTDSGSEVYCDEKCRDDFQDIRFTDDDGITLLDYWLEIGAVGGAARFWVEVSDDLSIGNSTIYMYYGNLGTTAASNGDATFLWFDGFDGSSLDPEKWVEYGVPNISVSDGYCTITGDNDTFDEGIIFNNSIPSWNNIRVETEVKRSNWNRRVGANDIWIGSTPYRATFPWHKGDDPEPYDIRWNTFNGSWTYPEPLIVDDPSLDTYYIFSQWKTTDQFKPYVYYANYTELGTASARTLLDDTMKVRLHVSSYGSGSCSIVVAWIRIRNFVSPEPSHGTWGNEEQSPGLPMAIVVMIVGVVGAVVVISVAVYFIRRRP